MKRPAAREALAGRGWTDKRSVRSEDERLLVVPRPAREDQKQREHHPEKGENDSGHGTSLLKY